MRKRDADKLIKEINSTRAENRRIWVNNDGLRHIVRFCTTSKRLHESETWDDCVTWLTHLV